MSVKLCTFRKRDGSPCKRKTQETLCWQHAEKKILDQPQAPLDSEIQKFLESVKGKPISSLSVKDARQVLNNLQKGTRIDIATQSEKIHVPFPPKNFDIYLVRPKKISKALPLVLYYHGGGFMLGNEKTHERLVRELSDGAEVGIAFVLYTLSPEAHSGIILEQAYNALTFMVGQAPRYNLDPTRLAVAGDSAGGNLAIAMTFLAKIRKGPVIQHQLLFYPVTDAKMDTISYSTFAEGPWLTRKSMEWFWNGYEPDCKKRENILLSPLSATLDQLRHLPPALVITDENDVLRDEGEQYAHRLIQAGNQVTAVRFLGTIHDFMMLNALSQTPTTRSAVDLAIDHLKKL
jgi:acetyl esterase